ncbi:uncharacterized protein LOC108718650 [Xenopus laevis]|uniref:Uncharacterized protein LOC108718650 n=1 Tax=Xenopus laevis TaxID=8355 RepID=A0A8J1L144_XENLA|nr:uncharacterized protein LOC108718650 [Xenopus laevis]
MISTDSNSSTDSQPATNAEAKKQQKPAQPPERPKMSREDIATEWEVSDVGPSVVFNLPSMSSAFSEPLPPACSAQLPSGIKYVTLPSGNTNVHLPADNINVQPLSDRRKDSDMDICGDGEASDIVLNLPYLSTDFKYKLLPPATCNAELNVPLPPRSTDGNFPPRSPNVNLLPRSTNVNLPPRSPNVNLPPRSTNVNLPPRSPNVNLSPRSTNVNLPPRSPNVNLPPRSPNVNLPPRSTNVNLPPRSTNGNFPPRSTNGNLPPRSPNVNFPLRSPNVNLPPRSPNGNLPPRSTDRNFPPRSTNVNLPPSITYVNLPPGSPNVNLPPRSPNVNLPPRSSDIHLPPATKTAPLHRCPSKAPVPTDTRDSSCPINIVKSPCHQPVDTGPLSQMGALLDQVVHTHSALLGSEEFLSLARDIIQQRIEAQTQSHHRLIEDRQRHRIEKMEMAQMQKYYGKNSSTSPPFSSEHFPEFRDASEDADWLLLNFEKLCVMCKVPEPEWVCFLPDTLKGKALGCYCDVPMGACCDYPMIKAALLKPYNGDPDIHRIKFRNMERKAEETFSSFYQRLQYRYDRWMDTANVKKFKDCYKPLVLEQLLQKCPPKVRHKILQQKDCTPNQAAQIADEKVSVHQETVSRPKLNKYPSSPKPDGNSNASHQYFIADKENILDFLDFFECRCTFHKLPKSHWVKYLYSKLMGKVLGVCLSIPQEHKDDYNFVKAKILRFYEITPQTHWVKFQTLQRQPGETFTDFYQTLLCHYNRLIAAYEVKTFEQCRNLIVVKQLLTQCPTEVKSMTCKQRTLTPEVLARTADKYLILHPDLQQNQTSKKLVSEVPPIVRPTQVTFQDGSTFSRCSSAETVQRKQDFPWP